MLVVNLDKEGDLLVASIEPWNFFLIHLWNLKINEARTPDTTQHYYTNTSTTIII